MPAPHPLHAGAAGRPQEPVLFPLQRPLHLTGSLLLQGLLSCLQIPPLSLLSFGLVSHNPSESSLQKNVQRTSPPSVGGFLEPITQCQGLCSPQSHFRGELSALTRAYAPPLQAPKRPSCLDVTAVCQYLHHEIAVPSHAVNECWLPLADPQVI